MANDKYELLTDDTVTSWDGRTLYRIRALRAFAFVAAGALGGYVEAEHSLSAAGNAWVYGDARVYGNASQTPIVISGLTWTVTIADQRMTIGCQDHDIEAWRNFNEGEIRAMDTGARLFWATYKATIFHIVDATNRPFPVPAEETPAAADPAVANG